jgi:hypothetical protein
MVHLFLVIFHDSLSRFEKVDRLLYVTRNDDKRLKNRLFFFTVFKGRFVRVKCGANVKRTLVNLDTRYRRNELSIFLCDSLEEMMK